MCCDNLVCGSCSRPVAEAGCTVCRAARAQFHGSQRHGGQPLPVATFLAAVAALLLVAVLLSR